MPRFDDDLFEGGQVRACQPRAQKRAECHAYAKDMALNENPPLPDVHVEPEQDSHPLDISTGELGALQATDTTLDAPCHICHADFEAK